MWRRVAVVRTDVSEEHIASIIKDERISELGTSATIRNRHKLRRKKKNNILRSLLLLLLTALFLGRRFMSPWWWNRYGPPKRRFFQEPYGITSQKAAFLFTSSFIITIRALWVNFFSGGIDCTGVFPGYQDFVQNCCCRWVISLISRIE
jgi:hypothetical protein